MLTLGTTGPGLPRCHFLQFCKSRCVETWPPLRDTWRRFGFFGPRVVFRYRRHLIDPANSRNTAANSATGRSRNTAHCSAGNATIIPRCNCGMSNATASLDNDSTASAPWAERTAPFRNATALDATNPRQNANHAAFGSLQVAGSAWSVCDISKNRPSIVHRFRSNSLPATPLAAVAGRFVTRCSTVSPSCQVASPNDG